MIEVIKKLKNYTFDSKMIICEIYAQRLMNPNELDIIGNINGVMPNELEIFMLYSVIYDDDESTLEINHRDFSEIITAIRNFRHPKWDEFEMDNKYSENFMMISGLTQFSVQGNVSQRFFRYDYFFTFINDDIDMKQEFNKKFGCDYDHFRRFAFSIYLLLSDKNQSTSKQKVMTYLWKEYRNAAKLLKIDKKSYKKAVVDLLGDDILNYYYGLKIQYLFPIIEGINFQYQPIPYLLINATTDSLLHRLTEGNEELRRSIGKNVLEQYLYDLYTEIENIDHIYPEQKYYIGKKELLSPDVIVIEDDYCMMFDTKLSVPSIRMRTFDKSAIDKAIKIAAENVKKIFFHINNYDQGHFELDRKINRNNVFGVIVQLEDFYVSRKEIYETARQMINSDAAKMTEDEYSFMCSNIKIVGLRDVEQALFKGQSYLKYLIHNKSNKEKWFDIFLTNVPEIVNDSTVIRSLEKFVNKEKNEFLLDVKAAKRM